MKSKTESVSSLLKDFQYRFDLKPVFDDFLTLTICAFGFNPNTQKSYDEDLYLETVKKYSTSELRHHFPKMLALLTIEMEERYSSSAGNDVLGEIFELEFCQKSKSQFFTPWPICEFMASTMSGNESEGRLRIIDPTCGSGRMLVAGAKHIGREHDYYGIAIDHLCVKMTALNLFLNGIFHAEVMCSNALMPNDFRVSYKLSFLPFGIFRIADRERSPLWHLYQHNFKVEPKARLSDNLDLSKDNDRSEPPASQLNLF